MRKLWKPGSTLPSWKKILLTPVVAVLYALEMMGKGMHYAFPVITAKTTMIGTPYWDVVSSKGRLISATAFNVFISSFWLYTTLTSHRGFGSFGDGFLSVINPVNFMLFSVQLVKYLIVFKSWTFSTSVLIGNVDSDENPDPKALLIARNMVAAAKDRKVKMKLINRGEELRAYFRNDDDAVLIRASA